jgi:cysteinyl-tRNA synthetase
LARFWVHNGFVRVDNEKMSKSLGNFFTIREVLAKYEPETVRFFLLRTHYRTALNYSDAHLDDARSGLKRLYTALALMPGQTVGVAVDWSNEYALRFRAAMDEDFGTPEAIAVLFDPASEINRSKSAALAGLLKGLGDCLGLLQQEPNTYLQAGATLSDARIAELIAARAAAKAGKDFARADAVRKELLEQGIVLKDSAAGTTWEVAQ